MKLEHPDAGERSIEVDQGHADKYLTQGWAPAETAAKPKSEDEPKK